MATKILAHYTVVNLGQLKAVTDQLVAHWSVQLDKPTDWKDILVNPMNLDMVQYPNEMLIRVQLLMNEPV